MADRDSEPRSPIKDFGWLAIFLIVLGVIWFAQGGPAKLSSITSPFLNYPEISNPSSQNSSSDNTSAPEPSSSYKGKISLSVWSAKETDPQKEYVEIRAYSDFKPVSVSDWTIEGRNGLKLSLGRGSKLFFLSQPSNQEPIILEPNGVIAVVSGKSPVGASFRLNLCTGYFNQFQSFTPYLSEECPRIKDEDIPQNYPDACVDYIRGLSSCRMPANIPYETSIKIGNDCTIFINQRASYSGCVSAYKNENNFYKNEWRVYLNREKEIWATRDTIILRDQEGKVVDKESY